MFFLKFSVEIQINSFCEIFQFDVKQRRYTQNYLPIVKSQWAIELYGVCFCYDLTHEDQLSNSQSHFLLNAIAFYIKFASTNQPSCKQIIIFCTCESLTLHSELNIKFILVQGASIPCVLPSTA